MGIVEVESQVWKKGGDFEKSILLLLSNLPPISQADLASVCFVLLSKTTPLPAEPGTGVVCIATFQEVCNQFCWVVSSSQYGMETSGAAESLLVELSVKA